MINIKLSIITVTYNDINGLQETINSIDNLIEGCVDSAYVEHVIIDGNSSDGSKDFLNILKSYRTINTIIISENDDGIYDAMNKGIVISSGFFVTFMNAGDIFSKEIDLPTILRDLDECRTKIHEAGIVYAAKINFPKIIYTVKPRKITPKNPGLPGVHQAMIYKREVISKNNFNSTYKICGDYENFSRIFFMNLIFKPINRQYVDFYSGGFSTKNPRQLFKESLLITFKYFKPNYFNRLKIIGKMLVSLVIFKIFNNL